MADEDPGTTGTSKDDAEPTGGAHSSSEEGGADVAAQVSMAAASAAADRYAGVVARCVVDPMSSQTGRRW